MNPDIYGLNLAPLNLKCRITKITCSQKERRRLLDIGFFEGSTIIPLYESPFGGTKAYLIKDSLIALRTEDAKNITVKVERGA